MHTPNSPGSGAMRCDDVRGRRLNGFGYLTRLHRTRERDPKLARRKKERVVKETGKLACEACGVEAAEKFGELGAGVVDAHHTKPLHTLTEATETSLADSALLCATCHRVIHAAKPWLTVSGLRDAIETQWCHAST